MIIKRLKEMKKLICQILSSKIIIIYYHLNQIRQVLQVVGVAIHLIMVHHCLHPNYLLMLFKINNKIYKLN